jgi:hypothetical protein
MNAYGERIMQASTYLDHSRFSIPSDTVNEIAIDWAMTERRIDPRKETWSGGNVFPI